MKTGRWYMTMITITFIYFYIYAVNYVRGGSIPPQGRLQVGDHPTFYLSFYLRLSKYIYTYAVNYVWGDASHP